MLFVVCLVQMIKQSSRGLFHEFCMKGFNSTLNWLLYIIFDNLKFVYDFIHFDQVLNVEGCILLFGKLLILWVVSLNEWENIFFRVFFCLQQFISAMTCGFVIPSVTSDFGSPFVVVGVVLSLLLWSCKEVNNYQYIL